jgi:hypothetical protein
MIGVLGDQHLRDQRFCRNAAFDDPGWCRSLDRRGLARAAAIARAAGDQYPEGGRHDIEALRDVLTDLVERVATAGADLVLDIDKALDPLELGWQRTAVGLARTLGTGARLLLGVLSFGESRLDFLQVELGLIGIELLGTAAEAVTLESLDDRSQALDFRLEDLERIELAGLVEDERAEPEKLSATIEAFTSDGQSRRLPAPVKISNR